MGTIIITNHEVLTTEREPEGKRSAVIFEFENVCHIRVIRDLKKTEEHKDKRLRGDFAVKKDRRT